MSKETTRREFLRLSALGLGAAMTGDVLGTSRAFAAPPGSLQGWTTSPTRKLAPMNALSWTELTGATDGNSIVIDPDKKFQYMLGFGAAFTDASCYTFNQMPADRRSALFHELFDPSELGLNVCRTCIGASDYSTKAYTFDESETPDPNLTNFSIAHDKEYILPMLRQARKVNSEMFLFSSPWTPPGWMKSNHSMLGGNMRREYMSSYAEYFVKFIQGYEAEGVPIQAVTVQNEVDTDQDGHMPACSWPQEYEADFVRGALGPAFQKAGIKSQIWLIDHNYNLWGRAIGELETPELLKYSKSIAWHGYVGDPNWISRVHNAFPDVDMYWTEGGPDLTDPNHDVNWADWGKNWTLALRNWCRSLTGWNLALDEHGKPNIGPFNCGGLVTVDSKTKDITRSGQYYALAHFSKFVKRDAIRISSESAATDLHHVAFRNPGRENVIVITNTGAARTISILFAQKMTKMVLEADSVTSVVWS